MQNRRPFLCSECHGSHEATNLLSPEDAKTLRCAYAPDFACKEMISLKDQQTAKTH